MEQHRKLFEFLEKRRKNITPTGAGSEVGRLDWGWYGVVALLSGREFLKMDGIIEKSIIELLNYYAWLTWQDVR